MTHPHTSKLRPLFAIALAGLAALSSVSCSNAPRVIEGVSYPSRPKAIPQLDIQVFREDDGTTLALTNTSARAFGPSRIWLNMWYSLEVPGLAIGETLRAPISEFRDEHGDAIRAGGFFATRPAEPIALAELESGGALYRLVYIRER